MFLPDATKAESVYHGDSTYAELWLEGRYGHGSSDRHLRGGLRRAIVLLDYVEGKLRDQRPSGYRKRNRFVPARLATRPRLGAPNQGSDERSKGLSRCAST